MAELAQLFATVDDRERARALTHPAWARAPGDSFERLEFLGDAVLGLAVSAWIFERHPDLPEGELSRIRAAAVSRAACAAVARGEGLGQQLAALAVDQPDPALVLDLAQHERVLAALTESVIGACFVQHGYDATARAVVESFADALEHALDNRVDAKSQLQELAQSEGERVDYEVVGSSGPDHDRTFVVEARLSSGGGSARGAGGSKKAAEQEAARRLLADRRADEDTAG